MEKEDKMWMVIPAIFILVCAVLLGTFLGEMGGEDYIRRQAIKVGVAHYESNKDGESVFVWNQK